MATIELKLPKMGESVAEASILSWLKKEGDRVTADEPLVEIATDKVNSEVPSPEDGILVSCRVNVGDTVQVGHVIAIIETGDGASAPAPVAAAAPAPVETSAPSVAPVASAPAAAVVSSSDRFYSPLVKNIAKQENISQAELDSISGTGQNGRVTKEDLMGYISNRGNKTAALAPAVEAPRAKGPAITVGPNDEIVEMDRMRRIIADHMVMSKQVSPHVTSYEIGRAHV